MNPLKAASAPGRPRSNDTRLLIAGIAAFLALVAYLAVAFATADRSPYVAPRGAIGPAQMVGPWRARGSHLVRLPRTRGGRLGIRVTPSTGGLYGAEIQQLALAPAARRGFALSIALRSRRRGPNRLLVQINTGAFAPPVRYLVRTTVVAGRRWRRFTFHGRLKPGENGLGFFVGETTHGAADRWFELRGLSVHAGRR